MTSTQVRSNDRGLTHVTPWPAGFPWSDPLSRIMDTVLHPAGLHEDPAPSAEVSEDDLVFVVEIDLPGVPKEDVDLEIMGRRMRVHATRTDRDRTGTLRHTTRTAGVADLELVLPSPVDAAAVTAELVDGVLTVTLPKTAAAQATRVTVR